MAKEDDLLKDNEEIQDEDMRGAISDEAVGTSQVSFPASPANWKHKAVLTGVEYEFQEAKKEGQKGKHTIKFIIRGKDYLTLGDDPKVPIAVIREYPVDSASQDGAYSIADKIAWQDEFFAHMYNTFMGTKAHSRDKISGEPPYSWKNVFEAIALSFNTKKQGDPVYSRKIDDKLQPIPIWVTLVYNKKGFTQRPIGNFIDIFHEGKETILRKKKDSFYEKGGASKMGEGAGGAGDIGSAGLPDGIPDSF